MARIGLIITDEMEEKLNEVSTQTHIATSELVRMGIEEILRQNGHVLKQGVVRGGARRGTGPKPGRKEKGDDD